MSAADASDDSFPTPRPLARPLTVLVVDDEPSVRRIAYRLLNELGFRVFEAADYAEAVTVLRTAAQVDLVITDVVMPKDASRRLVASLAEVRPGQRLLYMSAYPAQILAQYSLPVESAPFLAKPFTRHELLAKVRQALMRPGAVAIDEAAARWLRSLTVDE